MATMTIPVRTKWENVLRSLPSTVHRSRVERAFTEVEDVYRGHAHRTGQSLIDHCMDLVIELVPFHPDTELVIVALLHHVPELQTWNFDEIEERYGALVRAMVGEVHVLRHLTTHNRRVSLERLRLNFFRVSDDVRVFLLMLCHQLVTLRFLELFPLEERRRICGDILNLYAPAAARLGMYSLKHVLEDGGFPVLYPIDHERITEQLQALRTKHGAFLEQTAQTVEGDLREHGLTVEVHARAKHPYSIFQKMRHKTVTHIEGIPDLFALRVIVEGDAACYQALGLLHRMGYPVQNRFKDYIAFPKPNGYQSLHTTILGLPGVPPGIMVEVQIRTPAMHREAQIGVAAHWSYKEAGRTNPEHSRRLVERAFSLEGDDDDTRLTDLADHMFVLTPKGDVVELPDGATPLDFAFHVHTAVGLTFKAARVNGAIVPLDYHLENGDIVDIVRHKDPRPSPRWIALLKTASARNRLKRHLSMQHPPDPAEEEERHEKRAKTESVGAVRAGHPRVPRVEGSIPMPVRIAKCCKPRGDAHEQIVGVIGRTGEVRIHRMACTMLRSVNPERRVHAHWAEPAKLTRAAT